MTFYCPNCRKATDLEPTGTVNTKSGRIAYKAICPVCGIELVEFAVSQAPNPIPPQTQPAPVPVQPATTPLPPEMAPEVLPDTYAADTIKAYFQTEEGETQAKAEIVDQSPTVLPETTPVQAALDQAAKAVVDVPASIEEFPIEQTT